jgi:drug/metabolite transporter (DMT)-like permease
MLLFAGLLVLVGMSFVALTAVMQRYLIREKLASQGQILVFQMAGTATLLGSALWWFDQSPPETANTEVFWIAVVGTTIANILFQLGTVKTRSAEVSLTAPFLALSPGLVTISVIFLGEVPSFQGIIGIILMSLGAWAVGASELPVKKEGLRISEYLMQYARPFRMLWMPSGADDATATKVVALRWALAVAFAGAVGMIFDGLLSRNGNFMLGHAIQFAGLAGIFFIMKKKELKFVPTPDTSKEKLLKRTWLLYPIGLIYAVHVFFIATAYRFGPIAYVGTMKRILVILTILFGWWILQEKAARNRLVPGLIVTAGAVLLALDPSVETVLDAGQTFFGGK